MDETILTLPLGKAINPLDPSDPREAAAQKRYAWAAAHTRRLHGPTDPEGQEED